jgi:hypothetical protein
MVLVPDGAAPTGIVPFVSDQDLLVLILVALPVHDPPARRRLALEASFAERHSSSSYCVLDAAFIDMCMRKHGASSDLAGMVSGGGKSCLREAGRTRRGVEKATTPVEYAAH